MQSLRKRCQSQRALLYRRLAFIFSGAGGSVNTVVPSQAPPQTDTEQSLICWLCLLTYLFNVTSFGMLVQTLTPSDLPICMLAFALAISRTLASSGFDQGVGNLITFGVIGNADECSPLFAQNIHPPSGWMRQRQNLIKQGQ